jgi:putative Holliday junction resolvase
MAIDYGDVRTGVAVSDMGGSIVGDAWVITEKSPEFAAIAVAAEAKVREVRVIVVGLPKNMNGTLGERAEKSTHFAKILESLCEIEVKFWDERLTTVSAHRILDNTGKYGKKRKKTVDAVAAALILEGYLNSR